MSKSVLKTSGSAQSYSRASINRINGAAVHRRAPSQLPQRVPGFKSVSTFYGSQLPGRPQTGHKWLMAQWLEIRAEEEVPVPLETCWVLWENRELIPSWMPWIKSVTVQEDDPKLSKWTLSTHQFGRDWEFSWLARNLAPIKNQKIHWISEPGSTSLPGVEISNRGQIRFRRKSPTSCVVTMTISYELPEVLVPFANALNPLVQGVIKTDMERFKGIALDAARAKAGAQP